MRASGLLAAWLMVWLAWPAQARQRREYLFSSRFDIDAGESRFFEFPSKEKGARLEVQFEAVSGRLSAGARVILLREREFRRFRAQQAYAEITSTEFAAEGSLRYRLEEPGNYALVMELPANSRRRNRVRLEVTLTTGPDPATLPASYASPRKRLVVVAASLTGFFLVLALSGRALLRAARRS